MKDVLEYIEKDVSTVVELQEGLVSCPALSPENGGDGEEKKAQFLLSYLDALEIPHIENYPAPDERVSSGSRPNIVAVVPGRDSSRTMWIVSHMDVVPPGDMSLWKTDPYILVQEGDLLYGRGVEDNNQGIVSSILTAKAFVKNGVKPKINLGILLVSDEETGNKYGLEFLFRRHREIFGERDQFLIPDFGTKDSSMIEIAEKGMLWLRVEIVGRQCHASTPEKGINTLVATSAFIGELRDLYSIFDKKDHLFSPPSSTFEPTRKEENVPNINTIPGKDVFYLDCRVLPCYSIEDVMGKIKEIGGRVESSYGVKISYKIIHSESSPPTPKDHPLVEELRSAIKKIYGVDAMVQGVGGGTVAVYPRKNNYPAVVWATLLGYAHQPNECASIKNTIKDAMVMATLLH